MKPFDYEIRLCVVCFVKKTLLSLALPLSFGLSIPLYFSLLVLSRHYSLLPTDEAHSPLVSTFFFFGIFLFVLLMDFWCLFCPFKALIVL